MTDAERRKQQFLVILAIVLGVAASIFMGLVFKLNVFITACIAFAVLTVLIVTLRAVAKQFEDS
ncbi:MAG: hypothetical protein K1Y36_00055 [Blastocatellia bacterium]|nr:hypothetical protein [Blastocatellia bacterium]